MELSKRLSAVAGMVTKGNVVCDVGCDHGYVSIYLVQEGIAPRVIAMDVRPGPLAQAKEHIRMYGLSDYIETRLSDGVDALDVLEADTLILAGMGGRLMEGILSRGREKIIAMQELILQPQSEIAAFRKFLREAGLRIVAEDMVLEDGKFYPMMRVVPDAQKACDDAIAGQQLEDLYGGFLLKEKHPVLLKFLEYQKEKLTQLLQDLEKAGKESEKSRARMEEVRQEICLNKAAMEWYN